MVFLYNEGQQGFTRYAGTLPEVADFTGCEMLMVGIFSMVGGDPLQCVSEGFSQSQHHDRSASNTDGVGSLPFSFPENQSQNRYPKIHAL